MKQGRDGRLNKSEFRTLWAAWMKGHSTREIGRMLGRSSATVYGLVRHEGGIKPAERVRAKGQLSADEREEISRGLMAQLSVRSIARKLDRPASTISREINRNGGRKEYRAVRAEKAAWSRARRPKVCLLRRNEHLGDVVASKLRKDWSPQQIAGWLRRVYENRATMQVSHETIYRSLFMQTRGALKKELTAYLRSGRQLRRTLKLAPCNRGQIIDAVTIRERPAEAEDRAVPGHWEGDLIVGGSNSYVATLVERSSRYVMLVRLEGKDSTTVVNALTAKIQALPQELMASLTWDRGTEMAQHKRFTVATDVKVYFCDPRSPWQRGSNENTNGLLRQYLPRNENLSIYTQHELDEIAERLNTRPRKTLAYETPAERFNAGVALTG